LLVIYLLAPNRSEADQAEAHQQRRAGFGHHLEIGIVTYVVKSHEFGATGVKPQIRSSLPSAINGLDAGIVTRRGASRSWQVAVVVSDSNPKNNAAIDRRRRVATGFKVGVISAVVKIECIDHCSYRVPAGLEGGKLENGTASRPVETFPRNLRESYIIKGAVYV
jgi:hypothetical protein